MRRLTRDETAEPVSRDEMLRRERGQGNINFPCSADHEQDGQPYPGDPYSCYMCGYTKYTYIHTYSERKTQKEERVTIIKSNIIMRYTDTRSIAMG